MEHTRRDIGKQGQNPRKKVISKSHETVEAMNKSIIYHRVGMKVKRIKSKAESQR